MAKKSIIFCISRFLFISALIVVFSSSAWSQNVRIGAVDQGESYMISPGVTDQMMTFTEDGATVTAASNSIWNGRIVMDAEGTISIANTSATLTVGGGLCGSGDLTLSGSGTLLLNSASDQTGRTIINTATLQAAKDKVFSAESAVVLEDDGQMYLEDTIQEIASLSGDGTVYFGLEGTGMLTVGGDDSNTSFSGTFSGAGTLVKTGTGFMLVTGSNIYSEVAYEIEAGTLIVNADYSGVGSAATVREDGTLGGNGSLYDVSVESGGVLAPGVRTGYDVLSTDTLTVANDLTLDSGGTLSIRVDEAGNSDQVIVGGTYANVDNEANLEIDALGGAYSAEKTYDRFLVDGNGDNISDFDTAKVSLRQKFLEFRDLTASPNTFRVARIEDYFADRARTHNQRQVATVFDRTGASSLWRAMTNISNSSDQAEIDDAYLEISGSIKANSLMLGQWKTSRYGLDHLDLTPYGATQCGTFWLEFIHETVDFDADRNSRDYGTSRTGILIGAEEQCDNLVFGMLGGYALPYLYSHGDKYKINDLQFGFYGGSRVSSHFETKLFIGFGSQSYDTRRFLRNPLLVENNGPARINGDYSGHSMSMALEFAFPFEMGKVALRPIVAFDSDLSWQYGYAETGGTGYEIDFRRAFFDRTFIRTGLTAQLGSIRKLSDFSWTGRVFYGHQIGGREYPLARGHYVAEPTVGMEIFGANPGKEYVNLGIGFRWNVDPCRAFYGNYDYTAFDNATGHAGSIGFVQTW